MHQSLDGDSFAIARKSVQDDSSLPRNCKLFVVFFTIEEALHISYERLLHVLVHNHILPACILHRRPQLLILCPAFLIKYENLIMDVFTPFGRRSDKVVCERTSSFNKFVITLVQNVIILYLAETLLKCGCVDDECMVVPGIVVFSEEHFVRHGPWLFCCTITVRVVQTPC